VTRRAPAIAGVVGVAVAALVVVLVVSPGGGADTTESPLLGGVAPALVGDTVSGERFDIDDHRGRWVLVNFFATWCPPCIQEHPELVTFSERNAGTVQVVSVAFDDTEVPAVERFFAENGGDWPVITGGAGGASLDYGVKKLPESFLIDPSGVVAVKINGGVTAAQLESHLVERTAAAGGGT
jgi:cytochrome c biogenesis protein CcmG, thiol:disulfide interchange protein DsbE